MDAKYEAQSEINRLEISQFDGNKNIPRILGPPIFFSMTIHT